MPTDDPRWAAIVLLAISLAQLALHPASYAPHNVNQYIYEYQQSQLDTSTPQRAYRVGIQVGHYQNENLPEELASIEGNTGAAGGGRTEVDLNLDVSNRVAELLRSQGVLVDVLPATVPTGYSADAFVAMHADGSTSSSVRGFKISTRWSSRVAVQDAMLVELLTDAYRAATALPEDSNVTRNMRGYYAYSPRRTSYRVSTYTPAAIVEMGFMTSAADREVMFKETDKVASGVAAGIMDFLKRAYGNTTARSYGYGIVDDIALSPGPPQTPRPGGFSGVVSGDWKLLPLGAPSIRVYADSNGGAVIATLPSGQIQYATLRNGDYYRITLGDGKEGWVQRNAVIVQM
jgi:hypothetical protein